MKKIIMFCLVTAILSSLITTGNLPDVEAYRESSKHYNNQETGENKTKIQFNKYSNYVHLQPEWNSYPRNILFDVTTQWSKNYSDYPLDETKKLHQGAQQRINQLQYLEGKPYLEVRYDYIDCSYQWIHYARQGSDMFASYLDYMTGKQKESDNFTTFSNIQNMDLEDDKELDSNNMYSQFIPICTSKENTSFDFGIRVDDKDLSFDVYFVPSIKERYNFHYDSDAFTHYSEEGCFGEKYQSFSGTCNVNQDAGLLIIIPDELQRSLTKVTVKLKENQ